MVAAVEKTTESAKHNGEVSCLFAEEEHVFSGGADGVIKVWDHELNFVRDIEGHTEYVLSIARDPKTGNLYSTARDGTLRFWSRPLKNNNNEVLQQVVLDDLTAVSCADGLLYSGDDKGTVTKWYNHKPGCCYNIIEEVKSMHIENNMLYTARDVDVVVTDIGHHNSVTKATIPGRAPIALAGPLFEDHKQWIACTTRLGKGLEIIRNSQPYDVVWTKEDAHELIINCICGTEDSLFSAGFDGKVKQWMDLGKEPKLKAEIDTGKCINAICNGSNNSVFVGDVEGVVKKISF